MRSLTISASVRIHRVVRCAIFTMCIASAAGRGPLAIQLQLQVQRRSLNGRDSDAQCTAVVCGREGVPTVLVRPNRVHLVAVASLVPSTDFLCISYVSR